MSIRPNTHTRNLNGVGKTMGNFRKSLTFGLNFSFKATVVASSALLMTSAYAEQPLTVVELYTSQGCSSCPPADKLLSELGQNPNVLALSFHVDYWDYIGWKDPYALKTSTKRQRTYAEQMALRYVYTPQIIVGGKLEVVGSKRQEVRECLRDVSSKVEQTDQITLRKLDESTIALPATKLSRPLEIWQVDYTPETTTQVVRGENRGKKLKHHNSVRAITRLGSWRGEAMTLKLNEQPYEASAILVQEQKNGPIRAALVVK